MWNSNPVSLLSEESAWLWVHVQHPGPLPLVHSWFGLCRPRASICWSSLARLQRWAQGGTAPAGGVITQTVNHVFALLILTNTKCVARHINQSVCFDRIFPSAPTRRKTEECHVTGADYWKYFKRLDHTAHTHVLNMLDCSKKTQLKAMTVQTITMMLKFCFGWCRHGFNSVLFGFLQPPDLHRGAASLEWDVLFAEVSLTSSPFLSLFINPSLLCRLVSRGCISSFYPLSPERI